MHILVLKGGISSEREISLITGKYVEDALKKLSYKVSSIDVKKDIIQKLANIKNVDVVFIALHGKYGEDGCIQGALELMDLPYTHSSLMPSSILMNKVISKHIFASLGIDVARGYSINKPEILATKILSETPYILKPADSGSTINVFYFDNEHNFTAENYPFKGEVMIEEYIEGRELHAAVISDKAIGIVEVVLPEGKKIYDYDTKYTPNIAEYIVPAKVPDIIYKQALEQALKAHKFLGCKGVTRSDFRYDEKNNRLVMLEINTIPGLTPNSLVPKIAAKCMNITFEELIEIIINDALKN